MIERLSKWFGKTGYILGNSIVGDGSKVWTALAELAGSTNLMMI